VIFPDRITSERLGISQLVQRAEDEKAQMEMAAAAGQEKAEPKIDYGKWARFRGPGGNGTSKHTNVPTKWDGEGGENILWKTPLELTGASSPVVWGDKVICTGGANAAGGMAASVYFMDATTGKILWSKEVVTDDGAQGAESIEAFADYSWAAPTPCTDGETIVALFATGDIAGFDFTGKRLWIKHLGIPDMAYGYASSPIFYKDLVIVQWDTNAGSKLIALKSKSGELAWEAKREDVWASWATPIVITVDGKDQIVAAGDPWLMGHDPSEKGKVLWKADVMGGDIAPSPIFTGKHVIAAYSNGAGTVAIDPTQRGDLTDKLVWEDFDGASDMISPATNGKIIAQVTYGELFIRDATSKDGKVLSKFEIGGGTSSSPTIVGDRVYQMSDDGVMYVAKFDEDFKPVSEEPVKSPLGEQAWCSPAFVDGRIFIRGSKHLWCIGEKAK